VRTYGNSGYSSGEERWGIIRKMYHCKSWEKSRLLPGTECVDGFYTPSRGRWRAERGLSKPPGALCKTFWKQIFPPSPAGVDKLMHFLFAVNLSYFIVIIWRNITEIHNNNIVIIIIVNTIKYNAAARNTYTIRNSSTLSFWNIDLFYLNLSFFSPQFVNTQ